MTEQQFKFCHKTLETPTRQASNFKTVTRFFFDFYPKIPLTTVNAQKLQCKNPKTIYSRPIHNAMWAKFGRKYSKAKIIIYEKFSDRVA